ncbi:MAG: HAD family hydrolase [Lachnospiraceae bacterium]|nr:HAD family hydrolase [Lachnospiraceae bacterium]
MKYRLICTDLDGTLLTDDKKVKESDREALRWAARQGIQIALVTSRMPAVTEPIAKALGIPLMIACNGGSCIMEGGTYLHAQYLSVETLKEIYESIKPLKIPLSIYRDRQWFVTEKDRFVTEEEKIVQYSAELISVEELIPKWKKEGKGPNKLLVGAETTLVEKIYQLLQNRQDVEIARTSPNHLDIFPKGINKGTALCIICEKKGIRKEETIAFGDQEPDIPMLEEASLSIAMGNAIDKLKEKADFITKTNNESGVAYALTRYLNMDIKII